MAMSGFISVDKRWSRRDGRWSWEDRDHPRSLPRPSFIGRLSSDREDRVPIEIPSSYTGWRTTDERWINAEVVQPSRPPWSSGVDGDKVELSAAQVESLRSEIADAEEREAHLKAQLEHVDEILRSARLAGYLHLRNRWTQLPGEPPIIDDVEVDDWLPRFVVLSGQCLFYYLRSTDLSPQDSTLLSDITEVGLLPRIVTEDQEARHALYILTRHGLRFECASPSRAQVDSWLTTLREDCNLGSPEGSDRSNLD